MNRRNGGGRASRLLRGGMLAAWLFVIAATRADDPVPITVQLDWKPGMQFAGLLLAQERGWYREAGLDVTIRANDFKRPYVEIVAEDDHTVGTSGAGTLVNARTRGLPIRALATMFQASPVVLISLKSRGLHTLDDLRGKTVGIHRAEDAGMLDAVFGSKPDVRPFRLRNVGFDFKELLTGEVDAAPGYVMDEPIRLAQSGVEVNILPLADHGWVEYSQVLFTSEAFLKKNPEAVRKFIVTTFRGWRAVLDDPEAATGSVWKQYPSGLSRESARESLQRLTPLLTKESPHPGTMRLETWKRIIALAPSDTRASRPATVEDLVDFRFVPELERESRR